MDTERPVRVQRKRTKGWRMPPNTLYVGRPSLFGNPYQISYRGRLWAVSEYKKALFSGLGWGNLRINMAKSLLKGKNLACWCPLDKPCHADILLKIANQK